MLVLIACEESQVVCKAFREIGHEAYSNDIQECSGGHPEWHLQMDCFEAINLKKWDLMIAHPPCTYLTTAGNRWDAPEYNLQGNLFGTHLRSDKRKEALEFVKKIFDAPIDKICLENPLGHINSNLKKATQIIQPYQFGDNFQKRTCLWLKNLPPLIHTNLVDKGEFITFAGKKRTYPKWSSDAGRMSPALRRKVRSKTFPGIAHAMAQQWGAEISPSNNK